MNNRYGLDVQYFTKWLERILTCSLENYRPSELARELARMSRAADENILLEPEFSKKLIAQRDELLLGLNKIAIEIKSIHESGDVGRSLEGVLILTNLAIAKAVQS